MDEKDIYAFFRAVLHEYPAMVVEHEGSSFIDIISLLAQNRQSSFRDVLAHIKCRTSNSTYTQWLLAVRSFALVTLAAAVVTFYRTAELEELVTSPSESERPTTAAGAFFLFLSFFLAHSFSLFISRSLSFILSLLTLARSLADWTYHNRCS